MFLRCVAIGLAILPLCAVRVEADASRSPAQAAPQTQSNDTPIEESDAAVIAALIAASIAAYRAGTGGNCACPNDVDRAGRRCGARSAHSRPGGWDVLCYPADITPAMIAAHRARKQGRR